MSRSNHIIRVLAAVALLAVGAQASTSRHVAKAEPTSYVVKRGDTLGSIGRRTHVSVADLKSWNGIRNANVIHAGERLTLVGPSGATTKSGTPRKVANKPALDVWGLPPLPTPVIVVPGAPRRVVVAKGDTWAALAARAGTSAKDLQRLNHKSSRSRLVVGAVLQAPGLGPWVCPVANAKWSFIDSWGAPRPGGRRHLGTDIFAKAGSVVSAPVGGRIRLFPNHLGGLALYLDGDDGNTYYLAHFSAITVPDHGRVEAGGPLGTVGNTGDAEHTPSHVHIELKPGGGSSVSSYFTVKHWCG